ncbi:hypothetical protein PanWU01x14_127380 [Parasponia andersonii]|uniref:Uncharacterized protein n=1 Tax=Parasponia andersonii TaxID=3476 RepID=A0A2P5CSH7_PARAD|nr:hypothetical protein PanWU01x14_127380 [Parasponia andersonii]
MWRISRLTSGGVGNLVAVKPYARADNGLSLDKSVNGIGTAAGLQMDKSFARQNVGLSFADVVGNSNVAFSHNQICGSNLSPIAISPELRSAQDSVLAPEMTKSTIKGLGLDSVKTKGSYLF